MAALDAAIEAFDLTACMGIGPTGLYNSFGDKRALFIKALEEYVDCSAHLPICVS